MRKVLIRGSIIVVLVIALIFVISFLRNGEDDVASLRLEYEPLTQIVTSSGRIIPDKELEVQSQIAGIIWEISLDEGSKVSRDDIIIQLEDTDARNSLASAEVRQKIAENALQELNTSGSAVAAASLNQARIALDRQKEVLDGYEYLYENGALDLQTLEEAQARYKTLQSQYSSAQANFRSLQKDGTAYEAALLQIEQSAAEVRSVRSLLEKHKIGSPTDGVLTELFLEEGELVNPGTIVATVVVEPAAYALLSIDETNISLLKTGQSASVWQAGFPEKAVAATVDSIAPKVDEDTGTVEVRLRLEENNGEFLEDMTVKAEIVIRKIDEALIVPASYILDDNPLTVLVKDGTGAVPRTITADAVDLSNYLVLDGLEPGEEILPPNQE